MKRNSISPGAQAVSGPCAGSFRHAKGKRKRKGKPATKEGLSQDHHRINQPKKWEAVAGLGFCPVFLPPVCSVTLRVLQKYQPAAAAARLGDVQLFQVSPKPSQCYKCVLFLLFSSHSLICGVGKVPVTSGVQRGVVQR